ncbi:MAG: PD40 domain-containing protein, partial [Candidatus Aminicenantes bacterium]|nr:PD40 domain-containing protein [Candidatus Aminicenantes bacterium]
MKVKKITLILLLMSIAAGAFAAEARFMTYPDIHGDKIVFTYEGDLWLADRAGAAERLTSFPGEEYAAKFSPDGQWLAFTGDYDGQAAVYLMPASGGEPTRLTYQPGSVQTVAWTPDGQRIVFRSNFEQFITRDPKLFWVKIDGSAVERLPVDRGTLCSFSADGAEMLYNRRGREEYQWKRYKGGQHTDIWRYNFASRSFVAVSDYTGKNAYPMWIGNTMHFVSDRGKDGVANLFSQDLATRAVTQVTRHGKYDVMMPETDGERIIYLQDGYLHLLEVKSGSTKKIAISLPSDRWRLRNRWLNPRGYIHAMDVGGDGKTALLEARGDLFLLPVKSGQT